MTLLNKIIDLFLSDTKLAAKAANSYIWIKTIPDQTEALAWKKKLKKVLGWTPVTTVENGVYIFYVRNASEKAKYDAAHKKGKI